MPALDIDAVRYIFHRLCPPNRSVYNFLRWVSLANQPILKTAEVQDKKERRVPAAPYVEISFEGCGLNFVAVRLDTFRVDYLRIALTLT